MEPRRKPVFRTVAKRLAGEPPRVIDPNTGCLVEVDMVEQKFPECRICAGEHRPGHCPGAGVHNITKPIGKPIKLYRMPATSLRRKSSSHGSGEHK